MKRGSIETEITTGITGATRMKQWCNIIHVRGDYTLSISFCTLTPTNKRDNYDVASGDLNKYND